MKAAKPNCAVKHKPGGIVKSRQDQRTFCLFKYCNSSCIDSLIDQLFKTGLADQGQGGPQRYFISPSDYHTRKTNCIEGNLKQLQRFGDSNFRTPNTIFCYTGSALSTINYTQRNTFFPQSFIALTAVPMYPIFNFADTLPGIPRTSGHEAPRVRRFHDLSLNSNITDNFY